MKAFRRGQPDALLAPDKVREIGETDAPANAPNLFCFRRIGGLSLLPAESGTNRLQTADRDERNAWDEPIGGTPI